MNVFKIIFYATATLFSRAFAQAPTCSLPPGGEFPLTGFSDTFEGKNFEHQSVSMRPLGSDLQLAISAECKPRVVDCDISMQLFNVSSSAFVGARSRLSLPVHQLSPQAVSLSSGKIIRAWRNQGGSWVYGQLISVSTTTGEVTTFGEPVLLTDDSAPFSILSLPGDQFAVLTSGFDMLAPTHQRIMERVFDGSRALREDGTSQVSIRIIDRNDAGDFDQTGPVVGERLIAWMSNQQEPTGFADRVLAQCLDSARLMLGSEFQVFSSNSFQANPQVSSNGRVVVAEINGDIWVRYLDAACQLGVEFTANETPGVDSSSVVLTPAGDVIVSWHQNNNMFLRTFSASGAPYGPSIQVNKNEQVATSFLSMSANNIVATYTTPSGGLFANVIPAVNALSLSSSYNAIVQGSSVPIDLRIMGLNLVDPFQKNNVIVNITFDAQGAGNFSNGVTLLGSPQDVQALLQNTTFMFASGQTVVNITVTDALSNTRTIALQQSPLSGGQINSIMSGAQRFPQEVQGSNGNSLRWWESDLDACSRVRLRVFNSGVPVTPEKGVGGAIDFYQKDMQCFPEGNGFICFWRGPDNNQHSDSLWVQRFDPSLNVLGSLLPLFHSQCGSAISFSIGKISSNKFSLAITDCDEIFYVQTDGSAFIFVPLDASTMVTIKRINEFNEGPQGQTSVAVFSFGSQLVCWESSGRVLGISAIVCRFASGLGSFITPEFVVDPVASVSQVEPKVLVWDVNGNSLICWKEPSEARCKVVRWLSTVNLVASWSVGPLDQMSFQASAYGARGLLSVGNSVYSMPLNLTGPTGPRSVVLNGRDPFLSTNFLFSGVCGIDSAGVCSITAPPVIFFPPATPTPKPSVAASVVPSASTTPAATSVIPSLAPSVAASASAAPPATPTPTANASASATPVEVLPSVPPSNTPTPLPSANASASFFPTPTLPRPSALPTNVSALIKSDPPPAASSDNS